MNKNQPTSPKDKAEKTRPSGEVFPAALQGGETILGDYGGTALITGEVYPSGIIKGMYAVEVELGTLYLDADLPVTILIENQESESAS